jgi:hypothetical protein
VKKVGTVAGDPEVNAYCVNAYLVRYVVCLVLDVSRRHNDLVAFRSIEWGWVPSFRDSLALL